MVRDRLNDRIRRHRWVALGVALTVTASACQPSADGGNRDPAAEEVPIDTEAAQGDVWGDLDDAILERLGDLVEVRELDVDTLPEEVRGELLAHFEDTLGAGADVQVATFHPDALSEEATDELVAALGPELVGHLLHDGDPVQLAPITLFAGADEADALFAHHGLELPRGPDDRLAGVREGIARLDGTQTVDPAESFLPLSAEEDDEQAPNRAAPPRGADRLDSGETSSVVRYVGHDGLPLYELPNFDSAEVATLDRGERVFVLDERPRFVRGWGNVFVRVHVPDRSPYPSGWMPLFWLYEQPVTATRDSLSFTTTYGLMASAISDAIQNVFYAGCDRYPRRPHDYTEMTPTLDASSVPDGKRYECGEYPIGVTQDLIGDPELKWLFGHEVTIPGYWVQSKTTKNINIAIYEHGGDWLNDAPRPLLFPIMLTRLPEQERGDPYRIRDMATAPTGSYDAKLTENRIYVPKGVSSTAAHDGVVYDMPLTDNLVRIHGNDAWFNVSFDPPAGVTTPADAYVTGCFRLPGGEIRTKPALANIAIHTRVPIKRNSHITGVELGGLAFSPMTVCATAAIAPAGDLGSMVSAEPGPPLVVRFVRAAIEDVSVRHTGEIKLYGSLDSAHDWLFGRIQTELHTFLRGNTPLLWSLFSAPKKSRVPDPQDVWEQVKDKLLDTKSGLEEALLEHLREVGRQLTRSLPDPERMIDLACDRLIPSSYASVRSPYHLLYLQCLEAAQDADVELIVNQGSTSSCYDPEAFARVSEGAYWRDRTDIARYFYLDELFGEPVQSHWSHKLVRPRWVSGCGVRSTLTTTVMSAYWPVLRCAEEIVAEGVNHRWSRSLIRSRLQGDCRVPAVKLLCDLYGDGADLREMWRDRHGFIPATAGYTGFCLYYRQLTESTYDSSVQFGP